MSLAILQMPMGIFEVYSCSIDLDPVACALENTSRTLLDLIARIV